MVDANKVAAAGGLWGLVFNKEEVDEFEAEEGGDSCSAPMACAGNATFAESVVDGANITNTAAGSLLAVGEKIVVNADGTWLGKNGKYYHAGWGGNGATGGRSVALKNAKLLKAGGMVTLGATVPLTIYDVQQGNQSAGKGFVDIGMAAVGLAWPLGTFASISYFAVDYANDGN